MATYPSAIKSFTNPGALNNLNFPLHTTQHGDANDEINAIETELGTLPKGTYGSVKARLDDLPNILVDITNNQTIDGKKRFLKLMTLSYGANVASAGTVTLGDDGNIFKILGTTTITGITIKTIGTVIHLIFEGALTVTDGSNLDLLGNFTTYAGASMTLFSDGTNWVEINRSYQVPALGADVAKSIDTVYQAATDGFVWGYWDLQSGDQAVLYKDASNPPTTAVAQGSSNVGGTIRGAYSVPVKKNDYYKLSTAAGSISPYTMYFTPLT